jgi:hypothetical protein
VRASGLVKLLIKISQKLQRGLGSAVCRICLKPEFFIIVTGFGLDDWIF